MDQAITLLPTPDVGGEAILRNTAGRDELINAALLVSLLILFTLLAGVTVVIVIRSYCTCESICPPRLSRMRSNQTANANETSDDISHRVIEEIAEDSFHSEFQDSLESDVREHGHTMLVGPVERYLAEGGVCDESEDSVEGEVYERNRIVLVPVKKCVDPLGGDAYELNRNVLGLVEKFMDEDSVHDEYEDSVEGDENDLARTVLGPVEKYVGDDDENVDPKS